MEASGNSQTSVSVKVFSEEDRPGVVALWCEVFVDDPPWNEPHAVIDAKVALDDALFFVAVSGGRVVGTAMGGYDGHRGWVYTVAVKPDLRRQGIAKDLMSAVEQALISRGCIKLNLQVRATNTAVIGFYESLGYEAEERVSMGKLLVKKPQWQA